MITLSVYTTHTNGILSWTWMSPCQWISILWTESNQSCVYAQHLEKLNWDPDPWRLTLIGCWHYSNSQPNQNTEREWTSATLILATQIITLKHHGLKPHHSQAPCHTRDQNIHSRFDHHGGRTSSGWQDGITQKGSSSTIGIALMPTHVFYWYSFVSNQCSVTVMRIWYPIPYIWRYFIVKPSNSGLLVHMY